MEDLGISSFAKLVIQMIGVGFGVYKFLGFAGVVHELWKTDTKHRIAPILALTGIGAEVLALWYFPDFIWLIMPFSFWAIGHWFWNVVDFFRATADCNDAMEILNAEPQKQGLFSKETKWIVIALIAFFVVGNLSRSSEIIVEATHVATAKTDTLLTETKAVRKETNQIKQEVKNERDTSKIVRQKLLHSTETLLQLQQNNKNKPAIIEQKPVYLPGKTTYININTRPLAIPTSLSTQPSNLTSLIKQPPTLEAPKVEEEKPTFFKRLNPFSYELPAMKPDSVFTLKTLTNVP